MTRRIALAPLAEERRETLKTFSCGDEDLDSFLIDDSARLEREHVTRTMLALDEQSGAVLGYVALLNDAIRLMTKERKRLGLATEDHPVVPALKIARLGVHSSEAGKGIGRFLVRASYFVAQESAASGGCRLLTVDSYPDALPFYLRLGFVRNHAPEYRQRENPSLRLDVFAPELPDWI